MREDAAGQYLSYKLVDNNQDWKVKWFYISNNYPELSKSSGRQLKHAPWWNTEPMQEGIQLPPLLKKIKALREAGLRAEHVAFSFMKMKVQPLMARDTLVYQYTGNEDSSRMPGFEIEDDVIIERLGKIFKDMPPAPSMKGALTRSTSANSSTGRSARPTTQGDPEATGTGHPHVATTTTAAMTDVATRTMIAVITGDVTATSRRTDTTSETCLARWRQAIPMARSNMPRGRST
jgi:hypothetical protein